MSRVFIVTSIYQLFNAINLTDFENRYSDTSIILIQTDNSMDNAININYLQSKFKNVWVVNMSAKKSRFEKLLYIVENSFGRKVFNVDINEKFDEVFISGTEIFSKLVACKLMGSKVQLYYYEDGVASYTSVLNKNTKKWNDVVLKLLFRVDPLKLCEKLYVYEPKCVRNNTYNKVVLNIPKLFNRTIEGIDLKEIEKSQLFSIKSKVIFLNAWFENDKQYALQDKLCDLMIHHLGGANCSIKIHPNEFKKIEEKNDLTYIKERCSFEIANYYNDFSDCILISIVSTANISPKTVYNQEPYIIYLYKIYQKEFGMWIDIDEAMMRLVSSYSNKERVFLPDSIEEYENILHTLQGAVEHENKSSKTSIE